MPITDQDWLSPPSSLFLPPGEVHAWRASLDQPAALREYLRSMLSSDEQAKAARFFFAKDRDRYIVARGLLRVLLGDYTKRDARSLHFSYNAYGKPSLDMSSAEQAVYFNLSHSRGLALYAFTLDHEVGIDVEYMKPDIEVEKLARHSFSPDERVVLHSLPPDERLQGFYNAWTRKEAYIKARGMGISLALDSFDVSLRPGEPAALLQSREDAREPARWRLFALQPGEGYAGALAVEGQGWRLRCFQWQDISSPHAGGTS
jgi:4'-phosphopantetheinyl transferase